jgi:hypothetical protein
MYRRIGTATGVTSIYIIVVKLINWSHEETRDKLVLPDEYIDNTRVFFLP